jgi:vancomycin permeability regulator SanA
LGLNAIGVASDQHDYRLASHIYWNLREIPATITALLDVHLLHPKPVLGQPEPIFPEANQ